MINTSPDISATSLRERFVEDLNVRGYRWQRSTTISATSLGSRTGWGARPIK